MTANPYLDDAESAARDALQEELKAPLDMAGRAFNVIAAVLNGAAALPEEGGQARTLAVGLMGRLSRDLRSVALLAEQGYPMQALSLAACAYEVGMTVAYVWNDEELANDWVSHNQPKPWRTAKALTDGAMNNLGIADPQARRAAVESVYDSVYRPLARAKHGNPNAERFLSRDAGSANGPVLSCRGVALAEMALLAGVCSALISSSCFVRAHLPRDMQSSLINQVAQVERVYMKLTELHNDRTDLG